MGRAKFDSKLLSVRWKLADVGDVRVLGASLARCREVDEIWPGKRPPEHVNIGWNWQEIHKRAEECAALVRPADNRTLGLWASRKKRLKSPEGVFYRLDYLEIDPEFRGGSLGELAYAVCFERALELGSDGVVLPSFQETAEIYEEMGFERRVVQGWAVEAGMVGFVGRRELLLSLVAEASSYVVNSP